jgi:hypothetical protein
MSAAKVRKRSAPPPDPQHAAGPELRGFAPVGVPAVEVERWPVHPNVWLEPGLLPEIPPASGLHTERQGRVSSPGFVRLEAGAANRPGKPASGAWRQPGLAPAFPPSDLAVLGWDPRAVAGEKDKRK